MSLRVTDPQLGTIKLSCHFLERAEERFGKGPDTVHSLFDGSHPPSEDLKTQFSKCKEFSGLYSDSTLEKRVLVGSNYLILLVKHRRVPQLSCGRRTSWLAKTVVRLKDPTILKAIAFERMAYVNQ